MKKILLVLSFILCCIGCNTTPYSTIPSDLDAMITSDLHYAINGSAVSSVISLMEHSDEFIECIVSQVIGSDLDVFIITGDITNDGSSQDIKKLSEHLKPLAENDIALIAVPGNHDYNSSQIDSFETYMMPLFSIDSRDTDSYSYTSIINNVCFLAMDDGAASNGEVGSFSKNTMDWLQQQLEKAKQNNQKCIFLSHHSVLYDDHDQLNRYTINNSSLFSLLKKYNVRLCFTGHQHLQHAFQKDSMNEIISAMPHSGSHILGHLTIENDEVTYQTTKINFETYASDILLDFLNQSDSTEIFLERYGNLFGSFEHSEQETQKLLQLFITFLTYTQDGVLSDHIDEIRNDPYYDLLMEELENTNYGPWMQNLMNHPPLNASQLYFFW